MTVTITVHRWARTLNTAILIVNLTMSASQKCVWRVSGHEFVSNQTGNFRFLASNPEKPGPVGHNFVSGQTSGRRSQTRAREVALNTGD